MPKSILVDAQCRFQLFEEEFDLPAQRVQLDHFLQTQTRDVRHQDFDVVRGRFDQLSVGCRKNESYVADATYVSFFLMHVERAAFRFRSDPVWRETAVMHVRALS